MSKSFKNGGGFSLGFRIIPSDFRILMVPTTNHCPKASKRLEESHGGGGSQLSWKSVKLVVIWKALIWINDCINWAAVAGSSHTKSLSTKKCKQSTRSRSVAFWLASKHPPLRAVGVPLGGNGHDSSKWQCRWSMCKNLSGTQSTDGKIIWIMNWINDWLVQKGTRPNWPCFTLTSRLLRGCRLQWGVSSFWNTPGWFLGREIITKSAAIPGKIRVTCPQSSQWGPQSYVCLDETCFTLVSYWTWYQ